MNTRAKLTLEFTLTFIGALALAIVMLGYNFGDIIMLMLKVLVMGGPAILLARGGVFVLDSYHKANASAATTAVKRDVVPPAQGVELIDDDLMDAPLYLDEADRVRMLSSLGG